MSYPFAALATLKYKPPPGSSDSLSFAKGERVTVLAAADDDGDWLRGSNEAGHEGIFPAQFVERVDETDAPESTVEDEPVRAVVEGERAAPAGEHEHEHEHEHEAPAAPPVAPKKPLSALQARIAALNAAGAGAAPPPGPPPRPSGPKPAWKPKSIPAPAPALPSPASTVTPASVETPALVPEKAERGGEMSAADAQESIGKGGSLKDRIAALQGGLQSFEAPAAPGRAPKPWKRKAIPVEEPGEVDATASPDVGATTSAGVSPRLESDSPLPTHSTMSPLEDSLAQSPKSTTSLLDDDSSAQSPKSTTSPLDDSSVTHAPPPSATPHGSGPTEPESTEPAPEATEEDKKSALIARMAGLGGQRVGMAMPALPRKAGPPRRKPIATPPPASPVYVKPVEESTTAEGEQPGFVRVVEMPNVEEPAAVIEQPEAVESSEKVAVPTSNVSEPTPADETSAPAEIESESETDQLPAAFAAPARVDTPQLVKADDNEDDFATPDLPEDGDESPQIPLPATRDVAPEPEPEPVKSVGREDSPEPESVESELEDVPGESEYDALPHDESPVQAHDDEPSPAPALPAGRPTIPPSFEAATVAQPSAMRDVESDESDLDSAPAPPLPTARPSIPTAFVAPAKAPTREPISIPNATVDDPAPSSPVTAQRPSIPASFVAPPKAATLEQVVKPLVMPEPTPESDDEEPTVSPVVDLPKQVFAMPPTCEAQQPPQAEAEGESEGEEEEEDPEVTRRRNLAARMAKLGGMNMRMGPMMPPIGGMRKVKKTSNEPAPPPAEEVAEDEPPRRLPGGIPTGGMLLPGIAPRLPPAPAPVVEPEPELEAEPEQEAELENEPAPPPLPTGRPSSQLPPRRSLPVPQQSDDEIAPPLPPARAFVTEPTTYDEPDSEEEEAPPPPPRSTRPAMSPPLPPTALPPTSPPPSRALPQSSPSKRTSVPAPARQSADLRSSSTDANSGLLGISIPRGSLDDEHAPVELAPAVSHASHSSQQPSTAQLIEFSTTLGGQLFAAAFSQFSSKARTTQDAFLSLCFSRAASAQPPTGHHHYGVVVLSLSSKVQIDEPRAGDVVVFADAKFKHNLTTTKVGTSDAPHVGVVQAWDAKKRKLRALEVGKDGSVEEGAWRMEELKSGEVTVFRVVERGFGVE